MGVFLLALLLAGEPSQPAAITGRVTDSQDSILPGATVQLEAAGTVIAETQTGSDGAFAFSMSGPGELRLIVTAPGFTRTVVPVPSELLQPLTIALDPAPFFEAVQVTSSRGDVPAADPTVTAAAFAGLELMRSAPLAIDDALRMVPGFTLFPSSRVSNPTTQTVMMRGLGGSGVNRSLVLADGVPLNDPFGGWIYWDKVPQAAIDRVEVVRGGGSDLYGADAVGGVIQILTLDPAQNMARAFAEGGNLETGRVSMFGGVRNRRFGLGTAGQWFTTKGYINVPVEQRGPIEHPVGSNHWSLVATPSYLAAGWRFAGRLNAFAEDRQNGTVLQVNDTDARSGAFEVAGGGVGGFLNASFFGGTQSYDETFSTISSEPPRASEDLSRTQHIPSSLTGLSLEWTRQEGRATLLIGTEARFIDGHAEETAFVEGLPAQMSDAGGSQRIGSVFVRVLLGETDRLTVVTGAHADLWHSSSRHSSFSQTKGAFSPRLSIAYRFGESGLTARASAAGGFRAPTLNELYRQTHRGNDITLANETLTPEKLRTVDGGLVFIHGVTAVRVTGFWSMLDDTVTSVTVATSPSLNIRQRRNADSMRATGVEFEADLRLPHSLTAAVTAAIIDSRFSGKSALTDYRVPQVAKYNVGADLRFNNAQWTASTQFRFTGPQFDDDVNTRELDEAMVVDVFAGRTLAQRVMPFVAIENLFDTEYEVGKIPIRTFGLPRAVRGGVQVTFP